MKKAIILASLAAVAIVACKKKDGISFDNAELRIKNTGTDTIYYSFNSSAYTDTLLPGATISEFVGPIEVSDETESTVTTSFMSTHGNFFVEVDDCVVNREIN